MKIFEKIQYSDGGPNDKGKIIGYIQASDLKEAKEILNFNHGFIQVHEISKEKFLERKEEAKTNYEMYKNIKI